MQPSNEAILAVTQVDHSTRSLKQKQCVSHSSMGSPCAISERRKIVKARPTCACFHAEVALSGSWLLLVSYLSL